MFGLSLCLEAGASAPGALRIWAACPPGSAPRRLRKQLYCSRQNPKDPTLHHAWLLLSLLLPLTCSGTQLLLEIAVNVNRSTAGKPKYCKNPKLGPSQCRELGLKIVALNHVEVLFLGRKGISR